MGSFILGSISPGIYSLFTSPIDKSSKYSAESDWEREYRNDNKEILMLLPFTFFSVILICFLMVFTFTTLIQIFNFILVASVLLAISCYFIYKLIRFFVRIFKKLLK